METPQIHEESGQNLPLASLGARLRQARLRAGLTQQELSRDRFSKSYLSAVERGKIKPSIDALYELAELLNVSMAYLLGEEADTSATGEQLLTTSQLRSTMIERLREAEEDLIHGRYRSALDQLAGISDLTILDAADQMAYHFTRGQALLELRTHEATEQAIQSLKQALPLARRTDDAQQLIRIRLKLGDAYLQLGQLRDALDQYEQCYQALQRGTVRDPALVAGIYQSYGTACLRDGRHVQARSYFEQVLSLSHDVLDLRNAAASHWGLGICYHEDRDLAAAADHLEKSAAAYKLGNDTYHLAQVYSLLGNVLLKAGENDRARRYLQLGLELAVQHDDYDAAWTLCNNLASLLLAAGDLSAARAMAERARDYCAHLAEERQHAAFGQTALTFAEIAAAQGDVAAADPAFRESLEHLRATDNREARGKAYFKYSEFLARQQRYEEAFSMAKLAYSEFSTGPDLSSGMSEHTDSGTRRQEQASVS
jgi:transcriptional regulator with XRE-family HTH domain